MTREKHHRTKGQKGITSVGKQRHVNFFFQGRRSEMSDRNHPFLEVFINLYSPGPTIPNTVTTPGYPRTTEHQTHYTPTGSRPFTSPKSRSPHVNLPETRLDDRSQTSPVLIPYETASPTHPDVTNVLDDSQKTRAKEGTSFSTDSPKRNRNSTQSDRLPHYTHFREDVKRFTDKSQGIKGPNDVEKLT